MRQTAIAQGVTTAAGVDSNTLVRIRIELALNRSVAKQ
jgi:hypothetical protein